MIQSEKEQKEYLPIFYDVWKKTMYMYQAFDIIIRSIFYFYITGTFTRRFSLEGATGPSNGRPGPSDRLPKIGESGEPRHSATYNSFPSEVRKSGNSAKNSELRKSGSAKQSYIPTIGDSPEISVGSVKSEERPFRLPPIRDGGSQIPGNSSMFSGGHMTEVADGDGSLAWEVDVSELLPHGRSGKKPGLFASACDPSYFELGGGGFQHDIACAIKPFDCS